MRQWLTDYFVKSRVPNGELVDKTDDRTKLKTTVNYMGNSSLLSAPMFVLLPVVRDIFDPPTHIPREATRSTS